MKKKLVMLITVMIPLLGICQDTNICLPKSKASEIVRGLKQGELLKVAFVKTKVNEISLQKSFKLFSQIEEDLNLEIVYLKGTINENNLAWQEIENAYRVELAQYQKDVDRLMKQRDKRIVIGPYIGYGISAKNPLVPDIQIGVCATYRLVRL